MEVLKPIIQTEEPDKYGRTVKVGVTDGSLSSFLPAMSVKEAESLRDELTKIINYTKPQSQFEIGELVMMRNNDDEVWRPKHFSQKLSNNQYSAISGANYSQCAKFDKDIVFTNKPV